MKQFELTFIYFNTETRCYLQANWRGIMKDHLDIHLGEMESTREQPDYPLNGYWANLKI